MQATTETALYKKLGVQWYIIATTSIIVCYMMLVVMVFRASNLILNLFSLMVDTTIPDIAIEPDKTVKKVTSVACTSRLGSRQKY